jgi:protein TonB
MPPESEIPAQDGLGLLRDCLVDGDAEERAQARKVRRRALTLSVTLQIIFLATLLIAPLFAKVPTLKGLDFVPIPPYFHPPAPEREVVVRRQTSSTPPPCRFCPPTRIPKVTRVLPPDNTPTPQGDFIPRIPGQNSGSGVPGLDILDTRLQPPAPQPPQQHRIAVGGKVQAAMLIYRVEPVYPTLMRQIRKSGRVELRAIISTDGTIQSLQVISGDPGFFQSALDAVRQWRYKPTILNGQPVEVETNITVIYNLN